MTFYTQHDPNIGISSTHYWFKSSLTFRWWMSSLDAGSNDYSHATVDDYGTLVGVPT